MALSDGDLVRRTLKGDPEAYGALVLRHSAFVHGLVYGILGHREDALEMGQAVFVRAFERLGHLRQPERFRSWLAMIATTQARNRRRDRRDVVTDRLPEAASGAAGPLEGLINAEERRRLREALARLPEKNRTVLVLRYQSELGYEAIADALGVPATTVRSRIYEGKKMLRAHLENGPPGRGARAEARATRRSL